MKPDRIINCRRTRKVCKVYFGLCDGCGHPAANCEVKKTKPTAFRVPICQACHSNCRRELEPGRYCCQKCNAIFEPVEQSYVDDRPLQNAMQKESQTNGRRRGAADPVVVVGFVSAFVATAAMLVLSAVMLVKQVQRIDEIEARVAALEATQ